MQQPDLVVEDVNLVSGQVYKPQMLIPDALKFREHFPKDPAGVLKLSRYLHVLKSIILDVFFVLPFHVFVYGHLFRTVGDRLVVYRAY